MAPERIDTYLQRGPEMLSFVLKHTPLKMCWVPGYSDYYPEQPGGRAGGRSIEPSPSTPTDWVRSTADWSRPTARFPECCCYAAGLRSIESNEAASPGCAAEPEGRCPAPRGRGLRRKNLVGMGRALIAPLRIGLREAGVPVLLNTAPTDLYVEDGVVRGSTSAIVAP